MLRRLLLLTLIFLFLAVPARGEYWSGSAPVSGDCCDTRAGCQVLKTVMLGSFSAFDPSDSLSVRVLSAALPHLTSVTEDDFMHFSAFYGIDLSVLREFYFTALANCLWADIIISPEVDDADEQNARTILHLFLEPADELNAEAQKRSIRSNLTLDALSLISEKAHVPIEFTKYLLFQKT